MSDPGDDLPPTLQPPAVGASSRDGLFRQVALASGLIDARTIELMAASQSTSGESLGERLVREGHLTPNARQAVEQIVDERLNRGDSASTLVGAATGPYVPGPTSAPRAYSVQPFGDYEILSEIARGGMGVVYKARQRRLDRLVALKMIRAGGLAGEHEVKRFYAEAKAAAQLDHPGIVAVFEVGQIGGQHFFSMALVQGQSLNDRIKARGPYAPAAAARLMRTVTDAVAYAHDRGIVHRDIKPHNILLDEHDHPRVTDFGLAKQVLADSELTATGQVMGTPSYMPPEQAAGNAAEVGPAADVYALGATLYCVLTGRPPFQASTANQTVQQVLTEQPVAPHRLNPEVPTDLETICLKCLRKEPGERYAGARELGEDLARFLAHEPIRARPIGALERGRKWVRRHPVVAALCVVSVLAVCALGAFAASVAYQVKLTAANAELEGRNNDLRTATQAAETASDQARTQRDLANQARRDLARFRYASDVAVAGRAWREGDVNRMSALLDRLMPGPGEEDLRGFEWYYLRGLERDDVWRLDQVRCALTPDGKRLAVMTDTETQVLDAETRRVLRRFPAHVVGLPGASFSGDSKRLIMATAADTVVVWDVESGKEMGRLKASNMIAATASLNADGTLATVSGQGTDHSIRVWEVTTGKELHRWVFGGYAMLSDFSPDGTRLAFAKSGSGVEVHDLATGDLAFAIPAVPGWIHTLRYHPSGKWIVAGRADDTVSVWSAETGRPATPPFAAGGLTGSALDISPDGARIATGVTTDNSVRLWDGVTGKLLSSRKGHATKPLAVTLLPGGTRVFAQSIGGENRLWDMTGPQEYQEIAGAARGVRFSPDRTSKTLAYIDALNRVHLRIGDQDHTLDDKFKFMSAVAFSADGSRAFTLGFGGVCDVWDVGTRRRLHKLNSTAPAYSLVVHPAGKWLATVGSDHLIRVWDAMTYDLLHALPAPKANNGVVGLYFQPHTDNLVTGHSFEGVQIVALGPTPTTRVIPDKVMTYQLAFSPDGSRIATVGPGPQELTVWSFPQLEPVVSLQGHSHTIMSFSFAPDGTRLASVSTDGTLRLWDLRTVQEVLTLPAGVWGEVTWSPDGHRLAVSGMPGAGRVWDTARGRAQATRPK